MITKAQFDRLLQMVMLRLDEDEYKLMFDQMDQIIGFVDKLNELDLDKKGGKLKKIEKKGVNPNRDYKTNPIGLSNVQHPITGSMVQIKFKRG